MDRNITPSLSPLSLPLLTDYTYEKTANGCEIYCMHDPYQEVFRLDITFEAGAYYQPLPLIASSTLNMLNEGTQNSNSAQIAERIDYYGACLDFCCGMHRAEVNLFSLCRYAEPTIDLLTEILTSSNFPQKELEIYLDNKLQNLFVDREKTSWMARKEFARLLFGNAHPYANNVNETDYRNVQTSDLKRYFGQRFTTDQCKIFMSGNITPDIRKMTENLIQSLNPSPLIPSQILPSLHPSVPGRYWLEKKDAVQSSLRIGKKGINLTDPDYAGFLLLNTVLGGYFGSRLMSNIREEKGYTYGIHSFNVNLPLTSYWCTTTEVNSQYVDATISEIFKEIHRLQDEVISEDELFLVKNYLYGELLRELDGVFAQGESLKHKITYGQDNRFYLNIIEEIRQCSAIKLRELAQKYLKTEEMYVVSAGKPT